MAYISKVTYKIDGMTCGGCVRSVTQAIKNAAPDAEVEVDLGAKTVAVAGASSETVKQAVADAGFEYAGMA